MESQNCMGKMYYPSDIEVDQWLDDIWTDANHSCDTALNFELLENGFENSLCIGHIKGLRYIKFFPEGRTPFYAYWQPAPNGPAPLLVHTPGYGAEICIHPDLVMSGYNVIHINPLGYMTPAGPDETKKLEGTYFRVLPDTVTSKAQIGYKQWLMDCVLAIRWAQAQSNVLPDRISFFGSSQGGFGSLMLGSLYKDRGVRCLAADVPFGTDFLLAKQLNEGTGYDMAFAALKGMENQKDGWHAIGLIDLQSHARRLNIPVMLTAGGEDVLCPPATIKSFFEKLSSTKLYYYIDKQPHDYTNQFITMVSSWFRLYA